MLDVVTRAHPNQPLAIRPTADDRGWRSRIDDRLTGLRGYAALSVMLGHYQNGGFLPLVPFFKYSGQCSLYLFFFLSSFVLSHSLLKSDPEQGPLTPIANYTMNRIFRIFPLLIIVVTIDYFTTSVFFKPPTSYWEALQTSITLGRAPDILWTMPVELTFYAYLPAVLALTLFFARSARGAGALLILFLAWCVAIEVARQLSASDPLWMTLGIHRYANSFVAGVLLYGLLKSGRIAFPDWAKAIALIAPCAFVAAYPFFWVTEFKTVADWVAYYDRVFPVAPIVVGGVIYGLLHPAETWLSKAMRTRFLLKLGEWSFGIYLIHIPMLAFVNAKFGYGQWQFEGAVAATILVAALLSKYVEKPAIALGHAVGRALCKPKKFDRPIEHGVVAS
jgi:peptidoglycan/LPS O-acetylase OafA/YrhL